MEKFNQNQADYAKLSPLMQHRINMLRLIVPDWDLEKDECEIAGCLMGEAAAKMLHDQRIKQAGILTEADFLNVGNLVYGTEYKHPRGNPRMFAISAAFALLDDWEYSNAWHKGNLEDAKIMALPFCGDVHGRIFPRCKIREYCRIDG